MSNTSKTTPTSGTNPPEDVKAPLSHNIVRERSFHMQPIVFLGTGPVAAKSLELLVEYFAVEAIVTKPKPTHHKGAFPVLDVAAKHGIPVVSVSSAADVSTQVAAAEFKSQLAVLIDFGIIVRQDVIDAFPYGIINSHFSLLPQWRGADPITFSILSGQKQTGVSLMKVVEKLDEGPLLAQALYDIEPDETSPSLTQNLIALSNESLLSIIPLYMEGNALPAEQAAVTLAASTIPTYSHKLTKQDGVIDLSKPAEQLEREIRAYLGWPGSRTVIAGKDVVITAAHVAPNTLENVDNKSTFVANKQLCLQTAHGILVIDTLKPAGKPNMSASAFLAGYGTLI